MREAVDRLDAALESAHPGVVDYRVERAKAIRLFCHLTCLGDAGQIADHHGGGIRGGGPRVVCALLTARVQNHLMSLRQQSLPCHEAQAGGRSCDEEPAHRFSWPHTPAGERSSADSGDRGLVRICRSSSSSRPSPSIWARVPNKAA